MPQHMALSERSRALDRRILREQTLESRQAWARRQGWPRFLFLGALLWLFAAWALLVDRLPLAVVPLAFGMAFVLLGAFLFSERTRA